MDRINKFLNARQEKNTKTIKYKNEKFLIKKEDLKMIRAYKSGKCLDPTIKNVRSRILDFSKEEAHPVKKIKKDVSEHFNRRLLDHYNRTEKERIIEVDKNEIIDIWENEGLEELKDYTQEWTYAITEQYEGEVSNLKFTKEFLEQELKRVYMKHFRPRDLKSKLIKDLIPKIPKADQMRPYPEYQACEWHSNGKKYIFGELCCSVEENKLLVNNLKYNRMTRHTFPEDIIRLAYNDGSLIAASKQKIFLIKMESSTETNIMQIIETDKPIKDIYIDNTFIGLLASKSIHLYNSTSFEEVKILKLKGDTPHSIKIKNDVVYSSTHKGIMVDSIEKSEIKNLGYVIDFQVTDRAIYVINNLGRLLVVNLNLQVIGNTVQNGIGSQIRHHPEFDLIAILFSDEIGLYKIVENQCIPLNTITGSFRTIGWHETMPWLYASQKNKTLLFT